MITRQDMIKEGTIKIIFEDTFKIVTNELINKVIDGVLNPDVNEKDVTFVNGPMKVLTTYESTDYKDVIDVKIIYLDEHEALSYLYFESSITNKITDVEFDIKKHLTIDEYYKLGEDK